MLFSLLDRHQQLFLLFSHVLQSMVRIIVLWNFPFKFVYTYAQARIGCSQLKQVCQFFVIYGIPFTSFGLGHLLYFLNFFEILRLFLYRSGEVKVNFILFSPLCHFFFCLLLDSGADDLPKEILIDCNDVVIRYFLRISSSAIVTFDPLQAVVFIFSHQEFLFFVVLQEFMQLLNIFGGFCKCRLLLHHIYDSFPCRLSNTQVEWVFFSPAEAAIHRNVLPNCLSAQILLIHKIENALLFLLTTSTSDGGEKSGWHPSLFTATSVLKACLKTPGECAFPSYIAHRVLKLYTISIHFLSQLLFLKKGADQVSLLHQVQNINRSFLKMSGHQEDLIMTQIRSYDSDNEATLGILFLLPHFLLVYSLESGTDLVFIFQVEVKLLILEVPLVLFTFVALLPLQILHQEV